VDQEDYYNLVDGGTGNFRRDLIPWNKGLTLDDDRIKKAIAKKSITDQKKNDAFYLINIYYKATQPEFIEFY